MNTADRIQKILGRNSLGANRVVYIGELTEDRLAGIAETLAPQFLREEWRWWMQGPGVFAVPDAREIGRMLKSLMETARTEKIPIRASGGLTVVGTVVGGGGRFLLFVDPALAPGQKLAFGRRAN